jgi:GAF domain-containing protein
MTVGLALRANPQAPFERFGIVPPKNHDERKIEPARNMPRPPDLLGSPRERPSLTGDAHRTPRERSAAPEDPGVLPGVRQRPAGRNLRNVPRDQPSKRSPASAPVFLELARRGKTWEVTSDPASAEELTGLTPLAPECLVPILSCENNLIGMLVFGQRLSEEPYSGEDKRLLDSVAAQAGIALENIALAERMAKRTEADRRVSQEMEIARQVQARLFPQKLPRDENARVHGRLNPSSSKWAEIRK